MAYAMVTRQTETRGQGGSFDLDYEVFFGGTDVRSGGDISIITINVLPGDANTAIRSKLSDAVSAEATRIGYALARTNITLPTYQKG